MCVQLCKMYAFLAVDVTDANQEDTSVVPVNRLANIYAESKEFLTVKQQLEHRLKVALDEPVGETPEFATNFLWQVNCVCACSCVCVHVRAHVCVCVSMCACIRNTHVHVDLYYA